MRRDRKIPQREMPVLHPAMILTPQHGVMSYSSDKPDIYLIISQKETVQIDGDSGTNNPIERK